LPRIHADESGSTAPTDVHGTSLRCHKYFDLSNGFAYAIGATERSAMMIRAIAICGTALAVTGLTPSPPSPSAVPPVSMQETDTGALVAQAKKLSEEGKHGEAIVLYRRAAERDPKNASIYNSMGLCHFAMGDIDLAVEAFRKAVEKDPGMSGAYLNLGRCHVMRKQWDLAIIEYRKAIKDNPKSGLAHFDIANVYFAKNDLPKAKEHYETAARLFGYDTPQGEESLRNALKVEMLMQRLGK